MENVRLLKAGIFHALGHPTRLAIIEILHGQELTVSAITTRLDGQQANISQHLAVLRSRRLVSTRKDGNQVFYAVRDPLLLKVLETMRRFARAHLAEDEALLRDLKAELREG